MCSPFYTVQVCSKTPRSCHFVSFLCLPGASRPKLSASWHCHTCLKKFQIVITATPADLTVLVGYCLAGIKRESRDLRISPGKHDWPRSYRALERNSRSFHWGQTGNHPKRRQTKTTGVTRDHFVSQAVQRGCWKSKWLSTRNWTEISRRGIARQRTAKQILFRGTCLIFLGSRARELSSLFYHSCAGNTVLRL